MPDIGTWRPSAAFVRIKPHILLSEGDHTGHPARRADLRQRKEPLNGLEMSRPARQTWYRAKAKRRTGRVGSIEVLGSRLHHAEEVIVKITPVEVLGF